MLRNNALWANLAPLETLDCSGGIYPRALVRQTPHRGRLYVTYWKTGFLLQERVCLALPPDSGGRAMTREDVRFVWQHHQLFVD